jgi:predicted  nucleic acid-binding Zn-ribbon protein
MSLKTIKSIDQGLILIYTFTMEDYDKLSTLYAQLCDDHNDLIAEHAQLLVELDNAKNTILAFEKDLKEYTKILEDLENVNDDLNCELNGYKALYNEIRGWVRAEKAKNRIPVKWMNDHMSGRWEAIEDEIWFEYEEDRVLYIMTWK